MTVKGKVVLDEKGLQGAKVVLLKNGDKIDEALTNSNGKYTFTELTITPEGDTYIIKISKPGHITVKHWMSTKAPDERKVTFPDYFPEVQLFRKVRELQKEKALSEILEKPISKFAYSVNKGDFTDDRAYFSTIKARVNQLFEILDAEARERKRLLAEYRLKQLEEEQRKKDAVGDAGEITIGTKSSFEIKYDAAVAIADESYAQRKYRNATAEYREVMTMIAKSGLKKSERDRLKKYPKRKMYDIETITAGLTDEEIDDLERIDEEVADPSELISGTSEEEKGEEELEGAKEVAETAETAESEETELIEEISGSEAARIEAEQSLPDALEQRDRLLEEEKEEIALKRQENIQVAAEKTMKSNAEVKQHVVAQSRKQNASAVKTSKNKEIVAQRNQAMMKMIANAGKTSSNRVNGAIPAEPGEDRTNDKAPVVLASKSAPDKDKKDLERSVVIVHNRIKNTDATKKEEQSKNPAAQIQRYKPETVQYKEESLYKTITSTIIKYPIKQDTLQQVNYLWGASYYYKNSEEIDEATYYKVLESLK